MDKGGISGVKRWITYTIIGSLTAMAAAGGAYTWYNSPIQIAKRDVLKFLDDPDSARFSEVTLCRSDESEKLVIGEVNSKNEHGGYDGKKLFITEIFLGLPMTTLEDFATKNVADFYKEVLLFTPIDKFDCGKAYDLALKKNDRNMKKTMELIDAESGGDALDISADAAMDAAATKFNAEHK